MPLEDMIISLVGKDDACLRFGSVINCRLKKARKCSRITILKASSLCSSSSIFSCGKSQRRRMIRICKTKFFFRKLHGVQKKNKAHTFLLCIFQWSICNKETTLASETDNNIPQNKAATLSSKFSTPSMHYHLVPEVGLAVGERLLDGDQLLGLQGVHILAFHMPAPSSAAAIESYSYKH